MEKVTCPEHRRQGYTYVGGALVCKGCGLPRHMHETNEETLARLAEQPLDKFELDVPGVYGKAVRVHIDPETGRPYRSGCTLLVPVDLQAAVAKEPGTPVFTGDFVAAPSGCWLHLIVEPSGDEFGVRLVGGLLDAQPWEEVWSRTS